MVFAASVLGVELYDVLWFFFIFCFMGVVLEMVFCLAKEGVLESRLGLLYLPLSPIYGCGGVVLSLFLLPYFGDPALMFVMGILVGTMLEYVASFVMEKAFHTVFWDYSDKPLNLHGRVCLQYSIYWGLLSILLLYVLDRWTYGFVGLFDPGVGSVVLAVLVGATVASVVLTLAAFTRMRHKCGSGSSRGADLARGPAEWPARPARRPVGPGRGGDQHLPADEPGDRVCAAHRSAAPMDPPRSPPGSSQPAPS